jgi:predicted nucleic acid-binding Zn ribbon protein
LPAGRRFCGGCGRPVAAIAEPDPPEPAAQFCVKCGAAIAPGKRFCKQCGHAVGSTKPTGAKEPSAVAQGGTGTKKAVADEASPQALPVIAVPAKPEPTAILCSKCGAVIVLGKRFCKQCGHALDTPAPTASFDSHPIEQGESTARESTIQVLEPDRGTTPPLPLATRGQTFSTHIDSAPSEILIGPPSRALPGTGADENFKPATQNTPNLPSEEEDFRPLFKFSGDEREPLAVPPLQADFAAHDPDIAGSGRHELGDRDAGMFRSFQEPAVPQRRMLLLVVGAVCAAALLGAAWFVATYYHGKHRPVEIATQPTPPAALTASSPDQTSKPGPQTTPETLIKPAKPTPPRQEAGAHETPARHPAPKPDAANSHPTSPKNRGSNCTLDSNMLSRMLDQADRNREQGDYSNAARQYRSVLNCDSNNTRAHSGLELTLLDIQHQ